MTSLRAPRALFLPVAGAMLASAAAHAQPMTEADAVDRALLREGYAQLDTAERDAAVAATAAVRRFDNPTVTIEHQNVGDETEWTAGVVQPVDISGRRTALRAAARAEAAAVNADIVRRRAQLIARTRDLFARCAAAHAEILTRQMFAEQLSDAERSVDARSRAGDTAVYDLRRVRVAARAGDAELALAQGERAAHCGRLSSLTGVADAQPDASIGAPATSGDTAAVRPDLVALEQRVLAASQQVRAARAARIPELELGVGAHRISDPTGAATGPVVSLGVTLPLFASGRAEATAAEARHRAATAALLIARREAEAELAEAAARLEATRQAAIAAARARDDASRLGATATLAYQSGESSVLELVDALETARDARLSAIALGLAAAQAAIMLDLANGGMPQ